MGAIETALELAEDHSWGLIPEVRRRVYLAVTQARAELADMQAKIAAVEARDGGAPVDIAIAATPKPVGEQKAVSNIRDGQNLSAADEAPRGLGVEARAVLPCIVCMGSGRKLRDERSVCPACKGAGEVPAMLTFR